MNEKNVVEVTSTVNSALEVTVRDATQQTEEVLSCVATFFTCIIDFVQNISNGPVSPKVYKKEWLKPSEYQFEIFILKC